MKVMIVGAPGPAKFVRRQLFAAPLPLADVVTCHTIAQGRARIARLGPQLLVIIGPRSAEALARISRVACALGCVQLMVRGVEDANILYRDCEAPPRAIPVADGQTAATALAALALHIHARLQRREPGSRGVYAPVLPDQPDDAVRAVA